MNEVAGAIADPVRREILLLLRDGRLSAGSIAGRFAISRPAVSRHLRVLRTAGLVHSEVVGRQRLYELRTEPLGDLARWLRGFDRDSAWSARMAALDTEVRRARRDRQARRTEDTA
ncbi:metalloregulator ArsR/SmtB family transcription factor [Actinokineospora diospyrosa]|uniref:DNA-binding transcriptional regulator, ArsR family n=1 Tax=Actinokineospora diospyrosa TaxID=103728 RepID=A0ABT1IBC0_9PSEU|nr:metalloregulator ArsR/SmtB family transcription factor [Actinokineospora diospyrosa]MCP2269925.1 DNA-binding transcriptional regulator, ArsR family [Actinokineospora diospyrosa]